MPKIYSDRDKARIKKELLQAGLRLLGEGGYRSAGVVEIAREAGVSKSFFYKLFPTREAFLLQALREQREALEELLEREMARDGLPPEGRIRRFLERCAGDGDARLFFLTQSEQAAVCAHLSRENRARLLEEQEAFFARLVRRMGRDPESCDPRTFGNLLLLLLILRRSTQESTPFLFLQDRAETVRQQMEAVYRYVVRQ